MTTQTPSGRIPTAAVAIGLVVALIAGTACSDSAAEQAAVETSIESGASTTGAPSTSASGTTPAETTSPASSTPETSSSTPVATGPVQITVAVGVDSGEDRVEKVAFGSEVSLVITNGPDAAEYHVHGIDLEIAAEADQTVTLTFVADVDGPYEVEDHETGAVILVIEVDQ